MLVGLIWILDQTSTILVPVVAGTICPRSRCRSSTRCSAADSARRQRLLVLLLLIALGVVVLLLVLGGIVEQEDQISTYASQALEQVEGWVDGAGADDTAQDEAGRAAPPSRSVGRPWSTASASGIEGLTSLAFFVSFALFSTFFLLKDFGSIRGFVDSHLGIPVPVARIVTGDVLDSLRRYFLGVSIVAAFNAIVVGVGALVLGVPLAGTIAVVTFVAAYVPSSARWSRGRSRSCSRSAPRGPGLPP